MVKSRVEALKEKEQLDLAAKRQGHIDFAKQSIMHAGAMLAQAFERVESGQFHLDDVIVLSAVASKASGAAARIAQALKTTEIQEPDEQEETKIIV